MTDERGWTREKRRRYYEEALLAEAPRLLSALDRCPVSASGGCLDREYWAWATKDFANLDLQRGLLVLAYLYKTPFAQNRYAGAPALREWIHGGVRFWLARQSRAGAFDHLYTGEQSWMAAAFTTLDLLAVYDLLEDETPPALRERWTAGMVRSCRFLCRYDEVHGFISNHRAAAAAALLGVGKRFGHSDFETRAWALMEAIYHRQSPEGWFLEYEGADPGYQSLDTHYQALFGRYAGDDPRVTEAVERSLGWLAHCMHPDGSLGGEYGSRGCPHFFPGGFEYWADRFPLAEAMARRGVAALADGASSGLADADTRNAVPMATSYVYAHQAAARDRAPASTLLPWQTEGAWHWPDAGIRIVSTAAWYVVFGGSKGGVVKVFDKAARVLRFSSDGYTATLASGHRATTHLYTRSPAMEVDDPDDPTSSARVAVPFYRFHPERLMSPLKLILFRCFCLTLGRVRAISDFVRKHLIIGRFLKARRPVPLRLTRTLAVEGDVVRVVDRIDGFEAAGAVSSLEEHGFFATVYMASARYFREQDLAHAWTETVSLDEVSEAIERERRIEAGAAFPSGGA